MQELKPTQQLLQYFRTRRDMLIFAGYCAYTDDVAIYREGDDFALIARVGDVYKCCMVAEQDEFVLQVLATLHGKVEFCGVDPRLTELLRDKYSYEYETHCYLCVWNGQPLPHKCLQKTRPMSPKYAQMVSDGTHYHAATSEIRECLARHPSAAIYIDNEPVCWCLCHLEGSLGMLYTLPPHRHKGYALEVMTALCNELISRGDTPYAYIVCDNVASLSLATKYNLVPIKRADYFLLNKV